MSKPNWTPGPYVFDPGGHGGDDSVGVPPEPATIFCGYDNDTGAVLALAYVLDPRHWEGGAARYVRVGSERANGNLLAAAPELDEACDPDTLDRVADFLGDIADSAAPSFIAHLRRLAKLQRAAKAKARGEATL